jgi:hypothetical protein
MTNGNDTFFDFFTLAEAENYRDERNMATNSAIARTWIESITFEEWKANV